MKKFRLVFLPTLFIPLLLSSCLTVHAKKIVEAPYIPEEAFSDAVPVKEANSYFYYSENDVPEIDGEFNEWKDLEGVHTNQMVYGGSFNPSNADGYFIVRTDGKNLYVFADVTDDDPNINTLEPAAAWRGDGVEFFFGTDTSKHTYFKDSDVRVRIIPHSKSDIFDVGVGLNDTPVASDEIKVAAVYSEHGYKVEGKFPLSLLGGKDLRLKQKVRCDFQINDADNGKERTGLLHWNSPNDNTYSDPSSWGNGKVIPLNK